MTELFGFEEVRVPANGHVERPVAIEWEPFEKGWKSVEGDTPLRLKRSGIWSHQNRNAAVAAVARRLASAAPPGQRIIVLVEGLDHLFALADHLAEWQLWPAINSAFWHELSERERRRIGSTWKPFSLEPAHAIITASALPTVDFSNVAALIRADGGTGLSNITPLQLAVPAGTSPLLLVDLTDRHHPALRRNATFRRKAYAARGCFPRDVSPVDGRVDRFLAARPVFPEARK
jgi:hypothetical protein